MVLTAILQNKFNYSYLTNDQTVTKVDKITYCMSALLQSPCIFHSLKKNNCSPIQIWGSFHPYLSIAFSR